MTAGVSDLVVTRENNRRLTTGAGWVKNGDVWTVAATYADGSMTVTRVNGHGSAVLPARYVAENVELAYASTAQRAQGRTVDTAHAFASPTTTREVLYVALTRGSQSNHLYVDTHYDPNPSTGHDGLTEIPDALDVLAGVLRHEGADVSATDMIRLSQTQSIAALVAEYDTIVALADGPRWDVVLSHSGLSTTSWPRPRPHLPTQRCSPSDEKPKVAVSKLTPNCRCWQQVVRSGMPRMSQVCSTTGSIATWPSRLPEPTGERTRGKDLLPAEGDHRPDEFSR